ncbi:MAG: hypothetical protein D6826_07335 [Alphaproteobacteria bacterium]|nr:MAG: hypothetical protein D6826_07335 [Alphaproteobacteria bacterium]
MHDNETVADLRRRLDDFEKRLAAREAQIAKTGPVPSRHRARIDEMYAKAAALREKIQGTEESTWDVMKHELKEDWEALINSFNRWIIHVDEDFQRRGS